jgi:heme-degrading monooxygenase HmoA
MTSPFIVIVRFHTTAENQETALQQIHGYVESFLRHFKGFQGSTLHCANNGSSIMHYASWEQEADFRAFAAQAADHPDLTAIRAYRPEADFYSVAQQYPAAGSNL